MLQVSQFPYVDLTLEPRVSDLEDKGQAVATTLATLTDKVDAVAVALARLDTKIDEHQDQLVAIHTRSQGLSKLWDSISKILYPIIVGAALYWLGLKRGG